MGQTRAAAITNGGTTVFGGLALTTFDTTTIVCPLEYGQERKLRGRFLTMSSGHVLETLWKDGEFILSRGVWDGESFPVLSTREEITAPI